MRREYSGREQAIVFEVPNGLISGRNNDGRSRFCDAMVCNFWRSRGFELEGFEIKVSRSDWQRELQMPNKAESHFGRCDRWWLITPAAKTPIAQLGEIPGPWGWIEISSTGTFVQRKKAPKLVPALKFDLEFAFALVRAAARSDRDLINAEIKRHREQLDGSFAERVNNAAKGLAKTAAGDRAGQHAEILGALQQAFGNDLLWMTRKEAIGAIEAVRSMRDAMRKIGWQSGLTATAEQLRKAADAMDRADDAIKRVAETVDPKE